MKELKFLDWNTCEELVKPLSLLCENQGYTRLYGIPRGGINAAQLVLSRLTNEFMLVSDPKEADIFIDDIVDSGATMERYCDAFPDIPFVALVNKLDVPDNRWYHFPWEVDEYQGPEDNITRLLEFIGEDPNRGGLIETPARVIKAWSEWTAGYMVEPSEVLKMFEDGGETYDQMVTVAAIPFYSHCEHHLAPFFGTVDICYIPNGKIVGLSKLLRLVEIFARRLQVQERMTQQIADVIQQHLNPIGVGVRVSARHLCIESRGVSSQGHHTVTTAFHGALLEEAARAEFLGEIK